jgi:hypothetical protein
MVARQESEGDAGRAQKLEDLAAGLVDILGVVGRARVQRVAVEYQGRGPGEEGAQLLKAADAAGSVRIVYVR